MGCFYGLDRIASGFDKNRVHPTRSDRDNNSAMASANPQYGHEILDKDRRTLVVESTKSILKNFFENFF